MKVVNIKLQLFELHELSDEAQNKAIYDHMCFMKETAYDDEFCDDDPDESDAEQGILINGYLFFKSGEMADITHYTGNHELAGQTWLTIHDDVYLVENTNKWYKELKEKK